MAGFLVRFFLFGYFAIIIEALVVGTGGVPHVVNFLSVGKLYYVFSVPTVSPNGNFCLSLGSVVGLNLGFCIPGGQILWGLEDITLYLVYFIGYVIGLLVYPFFFIVVFEEFLAVVSPVLAFVNSLVTILPIAVSFLGLIP